MTKLGGVKDLLIDLLKCDHHHEIISTPASTSNPISQRGFEAEFAGHRAAVYLGQSYGSRLARGGRIRWLSGSWDRSTESEICPQL